MNEKETKWRNVSKLKVGEQFFLPTGEKVKISLNNEGSCRNCYFNDNTECGLPCPWDSIITEKGILINKASCMDCDGKIILSYVRIK